MISKSYIEHQAPLTTGWIYYYLWSTYTPPVYATPASRTYYILAENRTYKISAEDRTYKIPYENRTYKIKPENRIYKITERAIVKTLPTKDPNAVKDYGEDWTDWLPTGDTITSLTVIADTGITVNSSSSTTTSTTCWLSGGTAGKSYKITHRIVTVGGRTEDRSFYVPVAEQ